MAFLSVPAALFRPRTRLPQQTTSPHRRTAPTYCCAASSPPPSFLPDHDDQPPSSIGSSEPTSPPSNPSISLDAALAHLRAHESPASAVDAPGVVHLVGTGPGDPGLLTLRAVSLMSRADVVLYDRLVSDEILSYVNPDATMIYVGKEAGFHTRSQADIHVLLRTFAEPGKVVIRLKGGDPFVFGRGGEETDFLEREGIRVQAVPGITAAAGIAAALGIPLTHRGIATSVRFLTGHVRDGACLKVGYVDDETTLVVYMGLAQLPVLVEDFVKAGLTEDTPAVAVERGTTPQQRVVVAPLGRLHGEVEKEKLKSPTLIIVGEVVRLGHCWKDRFEEKRDLGDRVGEEGGDIEMKAFLSAREETASLQ